MDLMKENARKVDKKLFNTLPFCINHHIPVFNEALSLIKSNQRAYPQKNVKHKDENFQVGTFESHYRLFVCFYFFSEFCTRDTKQSVRLSECNYSNLYKVNLSCVIVSVLYKAIC